MIWRAGLAPLRPDRPLGMVQRDLSDSRGKAAAEYLHANPGKNTTQVCMKFGITKPTLYAWWKRLYPDVLIGKRAAVSP